MRLRADFASPNMDEGGFRHVSAQEVALNRVQVARGGAVARGEVCAEEEVGAKGGSLGRPYPSCSSRNRSTTAL